MFIICTIIFYDQQRHNIFGTVTTSAVTVTQMFTEMLTEGYIHV